jgi:hypothetical protein
MRSMRLRFAPLLSLALAGAIVFAACSSSTTGSPAPADGGTAAPSDAGRETATVAPDASADAGADVCTRKKAFLEACGFPIECGANFTTVCVANEKLNSAQKQAAELACWTPANCGSKRSDDCQYRTYPGKALTAAQQDLLDRYCATCGQANVAKCKTDALAYSGDPQTVSDVFLAVWESSDALAKSMADTCTGPAADAGGADGGVTCERGFALCAGGLWIDALTACP